ncbi:MAG: hypothetical protein ABL895_01090 [Cyclobacteriaceae bacterium]
MKRLVTTSVMMLIAVVIFAQSNNVYWSMTVTPKIDKKFEWEKKIVAYIKTHMPGVKYRIWEIISGENTNSYVIVMGPMSYKDMDLQNVSPKGEALMKTDVQGLYTLAISTQVNYTQRQEDISMIKKDRKLKYLQVVTAENTVGTWGDIREYLKKVKTAREKGGSKMDIDVHRPNNSGLINSFSSIRFFEKMEELDLQEDLGEMYDKAHGNNSYYKDNANYLSMLKSIKSELRVLREDLSSL